MEIYNKYLNLNFPNLINSYKTEIAILSNEILINELFFIEFVDEYYKKTDFYHDQSGYLKTLFWDARKSNIAPQQYYLQKTGLIKDITYNKQYHVYIQVINDLQNPQLNGEFMIFKFGRKICDIFTENLKIINTKSFIIDVKKVNSGLGMGYPNYNDCHFINKDYIQPNSILPTLSQNIHFKNFNLIAFKRKEKLQKINKSIFLP